MVVLISQWVLINVENGYLLVPTLHSRDSKKNTQHTPECLLTARLGGVLGCARLLFT